MTNEGSNTVSVIDTATNTVVATIPVGLQPVGVAVNPAGTGAYVTNQGSNTAFSRVYVGAHYPGDVVAGLAVGAFAALALHPLVVRLLAPLLARLRRTPLGTLIEA